MGKGRGRGRGRNRDWSSAGYLQASHVPTAPLSPKTPREVMMIDQNIEIRTGNGVAEALLVRPDSSDPLPGVINFTDGLGFRPAFAEQSKRIAERGYVVLAPNIFYRTSKLPVFTFEPDFGSDRT